MTSQINPNNIDGSYPVAGQDNNSQGFRDNFTNIKVNFQDAAAEITDLQNKVILKAALDGTTLDNNFGDALLIAAQIQDFAAAKTTITDTMQLGTTKPLPPAAVSTCPLSTFLVLESMVTSSCNSTSPTLHTQLLSMQALVSWVLRAFKAMYLAEQQLAP